MKTINKKVLVLGAHCDDVSLGCGASIRRLSDEGAQIRMINFTDGGSARLKSLLGGSGEDRRPLLPKECEILGIENYISYDFADNQLDSVPLLDVVQSIEEYIVKENFIPDIVFTHTPFCLNIDHRKVYEATITCFRGLEKYNPIKILSYEVVSSTEWHPINQFSPNVYIDVTKYIQYKKKSLEIYAEEMRPLPHPRNWENVLNKMSVSGSECGCLYAERFQLVRETI